ncbi:MAG: D-glycero-alpha-D-manno-heptose-1,7-bisphosphate 7-phosphatase [Candidatus Binatia bacterium]
MVKRPAVFVDRDGTLISDVGYLCRSDQIRVLPRVPEAIQLLHRHGLGVVLVTNQSGVARGFITEQELCQIHQEIERRLGRAGAFLDGIYYCPHHPTEGAYPYRVSCECRKPGVGLVEQACLDLGLDANRSYVIGDQLIDMELAARIGAKGILIENSTPGSKGKSQWVGAASVVAVERDFSRASQWVVRDQCSGTYLKEERE